MENKTPLQILTQIEDAAHQQAQALDDGNPSEAYDNVGETLDFFLACLKHLRVGHGQVDLSALAHDFQKILAPI